VNWGELDGGAPVTGDLGAVERVAAEFGRVGGEAEVLTRRLRAIGDVGGAQVWRGEAAEVFRRLLADTEPELVTLSTSHESAERTMRRYALVLGDALDDARRALADGAAATAARDEASRRRDAARDEAESAASTARSAEDGIRTAQAHSLIAVDPVYQAELQQYEIRMRAQHDRARSREAEARARQATGQADVDRAAGRLEAAKRLAHQAAQLRDQAARATSRELDDAGRAAIDERNVLQRWWEGAGDLVREVTASPEFASFLNVLSALGDVANGIGTVLLAIPGLQVYAPGFLLLGVGLKGAAFLGTLVAYHYGHAGGSQLSGRALDLVLALVPGAGPLRVAAKAVLTKLPAGIVTGARTIARSIDDGKRALSRKLAAPADGDAILMRRLHLSPDRYFTGARTTTEHLRLVNGATQVEQAGQRFVADVRRFDDPAERDTFQDVAPDAAGPFLMGAGRAAGAPVAGGVAEQVANLGVNADDMGEYAREVSR